MRISDWSSDVCSSDLTNQGIIRRLAENNCVAFNKKPKLGTILGILTIARATRNKDIARIEPFGSFARANSVDPARVPGPLLIAQSSKDTIVAPAVTRKFAKAVCRRGTPLRWIDMTGGHEIGRAHVRTPGTNAHLV